MREAPFAAGGVIPSPSTEVLVPIMIRGGLVSFDGERGPWMQILTREQVQEYVDKAVETLRSNTKETT